MSKSERVRTPVIPQKKKGEQSSIIMIIILLWAQTVGGRVFGVRGFGNLLGVSVVQAFLW
ncbi:hypothetical protein HMPREF9554_02125 [Treponema phagedenis F0421]|nr:hypothetical protein HMPREF9554_02125 [Treponema phagedenis F0421]